jgi:3D (Asp-Asp-Asp) domain-containing protein
VPREGGCPLKRTKVKRLCGFLVSGRSVLTVIVLAVAICVLSSAADMGDPNAPSRMTLLSAAATKADTASRPGPNESQMKAEPQQPQPDSTANKTLDNSAQPGEWQTVQMRATAYCPCKKCCGKYADGVTASGHKIRPGDAFVAADRKYAFGTKMIIPGYNNTQPVEVLDRGGAISGNRLDVFFNYHQEALEWGVKYLDVKVRRK